MQIETSRFGTLEIQEEQIITVPSGLIGFPEDKRYVLLEHKQGSPFLWFQSVDHGPLAFVLIDPLLVKPDYSVHLNPEDRRMLQLPPDGAGLQILVIVNISRGEPVEITANLLGPILLNVPKRLARQIILYQGNHPTRYPIPTIQK